MESSTRPFDVTIAHKLRDKDDIFIVAAVHNFHLKMVKIQVTGVSSFVWIDAKSNPLASADTKCRDEATFSVDCFGGVSESQSQLSVKLLAGIESGIYVSLINVTRSIM